MTKKVGMGTFFKGKRFIAGITHLYILLIILSNWNEVYSQNNSPEWFAEECVFPMLKYDLLEVQPFAGLMLLFPEKVAYEGLYIPVNIGFRKSFIQWEMFSMQFDLALGAAAYTQFEVIQIDKNTYRGGLLNSDFKASGFLFTSKGNTISGYSCSIFRPTLVTIICCVTRILN